ncbi:MAG TPA: signal peptidase II [Methylomirabilota bacterium]|jgi:signal peptidase II|nr:signal peptidase II [Methylomirabilota bacterium]
MWLVPVLAALVFAADQLSKAWVLARLDAADPVILVPGLFQLVLVRNPGVAFGIFAGVPAGWRWVVTVFSLTALALLGSVALRMLPRGSLLARIAVGCVFGGAVGNLLDRWRFGAVVDFLDVFWGPYHWPAFNVADSAITVGVCVLAIELALGRDGVPRRDAAGA